MKSTAPIPFHTTDWSEIEVTSHAGERGIALWRTRQLGSLRIRHVEYTAGYVADHWCSKGHILYCIEGEMLTELSSGDHFLLKPGMSYQVSDEMSMHRSSTTAGAKLFIIDGDFLQQQPIKKGIWM